MASASMDLWCKNEAQKCNNTASIKIWLSESKIFAMCGI